MEDSLSVKSNESVATSEEFYFIGEKPEVSKTPTLDFKNGDLNELTNALTEVLKEPDGNSQLMLDMDQVQDLSDVIENEGIKIGQSRFYVEPGKDPLSMDSLSPTEKQDSMKPDTSSEEEGCSELI